MNNKLKLAIISSVIVAAINAIHPVAYAEPASKKLVEFKQSDGSSVWLRKWGDEFTSNTISSTKFILALYGRRPIDKQWWH